MLNSEKMLTHLFVLGPRNLGRRIEDSFLQPFAIVLTGL